MLIVSTVMLCALFDRARGGGWPLVRPWAWTLFYGWVVAALCGYPLDGWLTAVIAIGWAVGERPGWGAPVGQVRRGGPRWALPPDPNPERYQLWFGGFMNRHPLVALAFRGAVWGLPVLLVALPFGVVVWEPLVSMAVAMPLAEALYYWLQRYDPPWPKSWAGGWNELYRGGVFGAILAAISQAA